VTQRILHLVPTLEGGGAERQVGYLSAGLAELGWDVHVGHVRGGPNLERLIASGATLHPLAAGSNYDPRLVWRAVRLIRDVAPVAVQTWLPMMDVVGGAAAVIAGVPWILSERSDSALRPGRGQIGLRRQIARGASAVVSNSDAGSAYWIRRIGEDRCSVIPNALPLDEIEAAVPAKRATFDIPDDAPLVVYVGRLEPLKNISRMLDALERVISETDTRVLLCGRGSIESDVERRIAGGVLRGRVLAPGFVPDPWSWLKAADLFVSLSLWEGMPNTVMEAMAAECPVVVSDIPNHRAILDSSSAWFVPVGDTDAIAKAILDGLRDPDREARIAAAKRRADTWSIGASARRWAALYEGLAAVGRGPAKRSEQT